MTSGKVENKNKVQIEASFRAAIVSKRFRFRNIILRQKRCQRSNKMIARCKILKAVETMAETNLT